MSDAQQERLIAAIDTLSARIDLLSARIERVAESLEKPSPAWRRMLDEFKGAISRMPTSIRIRH
jgi:hypothetical protein